MKIEVCEESRIVYYWLTREERDNHPELKTEYKNWKSKKYEVCTFISGSENLLDLTKDLLKHNKEVIAQNNVPDTKGTESDNLSFFIQSIFFDFGKNL